MTDEQQPTTPEATEDVFKTAAAAAALNGATIHQAADEPPAEPDRDTALQEIQTSLGVLQLQMAVALALALLSLSLLTYGLKQGRPRA